MVFLERSLERKSIEAERYQQIVAGLTQTNNQLSARVLELEAPREARETPETASEGAGPRSSSTGGDQEPAEGRRKPWYKRWFG